MGFGKHGFIFTMIGGIGLGMVYYLSKSQGIDIPQIELVTAGLLGLFLIGLASSTHGAKAHLRKHGHIK